MFSKLPFNILLYCHTLHNDPITEKRPEAPVAWNDTCISSNSYLLSTQFLKWTLESNRRSSACNKRGNAFLIPENTEVSWKLFAFHWEETKKLAIASGRKTKSHWSQCSCHLPVNEWWLQTQGPDWNILVQGEPAQGKIPTSSWALAVRASALLPRKFTGISAARSWKKKFASKSSCTPTPSSESNQYQVL